MKLGILGGGQLGQMISYSVLPLGIDVKIVDDSSECCCRNLVGFKNIDFSKKEEIAGYFKDVDVVTYEFENIPVELLKFIEEKKTIYPPLSALEVSRDRSKEKNFVSTINIPIPKNVLASSFKELLTKVNEISFPAIVKTCSEGYDGKGQWRFKSQAELEEFSKNYTEPDRKIICEEKLNFDYEVSCVGVRSISGAVTFYDVCENQHDHGILDVTIAPSSTVSKEVSETVINYTKNILDSLNYVGTIAVEYFVCGERVLFNEFAPRVHNSGHWTIEGSCVSQFENHARACLDLPLGDTTSRGFSLMKNLLGTTGDTSKIFGNPNAHYHWYGKVGLGDRRKVGHVTYVFETQQERDSFLETKDF